MLLKTFCFGDFRDGHFDGDTFVDDDDDCDDDDGDKTTDHSGAARIDSRWFICRL